MKGKERIQARMTKDDIAGRSCEMRDRTDLPQRMTGLRGYVRSLGVVQSTSSHCRRAVRGAAVPINRLRLRHSNVLSNSSSRDVVWQYTLRARLPRIVR